MLPFLVVCTDASANVIRIRKKEIQNRDKFRRQTEMFIIDTNKRSIMSSTWSYQ